MVHTTPASLHLYYDIETPGSHGYDRRHFPEKHSFTLTESIYKPRGRAHVPPPALKDVEWRPHGQHLDPIYSNIGPDWQSSIRSIPTPCHRDAKPTLPVGLLERNIHFMRPHPQNWQCTNNHWVYVPDESSDHRPAKRNFFPNIHLRSIEDVGDENVQMASIGRKKQVFDSRNGIPERSEGDKSYHTVELSPDFYKFGSTLPAVNFGRAKQQYGPKSRFVSMNNEKVSVIDEKDFEAREHQRELNQSINEVIQLDNWVPSESMTRAFNVLDLDPNDIENGRYRPRFR